MIYGTVSSMSNIDVVLQTRQSVDIYQLYTYTASLKTWTLIQHEIREIIPIWFEYNRELETILLFINWGFHGNVKEAQLNKILDILIKFQEYNFCSKYYHRAHSAQNLMTSSCWSVQASTVSIDDLRNWCGKIFPAGKNVTIEKTRSGITSQNNGVLM